MNPKPTHDALIAYLNEVGDIIERGWPEHGYILVIATGDGSDKLETVSNMPPQAARWLLQHMGKTDLADLVPMPLPQDTKH